MIRAGWFALLVLFAPLAARAEIITALPTTERVVALTFDACEAGERMQFDRRVLTALQSRQVPFTVFMSGKFARDNATDVAALARNPKIEIENHTWSHPPDLRRLSDAAVASQITRAADQITAVTARRPRLFRFPGGNADSRTVAIAEKLGYRVVHWRWPEGDPDPHVSAEAMVRQTLARTKPGEILIFHINGRGVHTADALPGIIDGLTQKGFKFVLVNDYLRP